jgi:hypothetical protein
MNNVHPVNQHKMPNKTHKLQNKLQLLKKSQPTYKPNNLKHTAQNVLNLSNGTFSDTQLNLLAKGLKGTLPYKNTPV